MEALAYSSRRKSYISVIVPTVERGLFPVVFCSMAIIWRLEKVETVPVDFPIEGVEVNEPVEPQIIERVELELYGEVYPAPVKVENPELPICWMTEE